MSAGKCSCLWCIKDMQYAASARESICDPTLNARVHRLGQRIVGEESDFCDLFVWYPAIAGNDSGCHHQHNVILEWRRVDADKALDLRVVAAFFVDLPNERCDGRLAGFHAPARRRPT